MRVTPEACYDLARSPPLRDPKLVQRFKVRRRVGRFLLSMEDAALVEGEVLRVTKGKPEELPLHGSQLAVHPQGDAFER